MRITEGQLRRIIREEVRQLTEMPARVGGMGRGEAKAALLAAAREVREMFETPSGKPLFKAPRLDKGTVFMREDYPRENYRGKPSAKKVADALKSAFVAQGGVVADQARPAPGSASIICRDTTGTPNDVGLMVSMALF